MLAWGGFELTTTEFRSDALADCFICKNRAISRNSKQFFQIQKTKRSFLDNLEHSISIFPKSFLSLQVN